MTITIKSTKRTSSFSDKLLICDECGFKHKNEKGYWGMWGTKFLCPVCLNRHMMKEAER